MMCVNDKTGLRLREYSVNAFDDDGLTVFDDAVMIRFGKFVLVIDENGIRSSKDTISFAIEPTKVNLDDFSPQEKQDWDGKRRLRDS